MIRVALETSHLKREILFLTCTMWSMVIIVIWPLFRKMRVNQNPLNQIGIFWYHFTPRNSLYHMVSVKFVKFGPQWLFGFFLWATLYIHFLILHQKCGNSFEIIMMTPKRRFWYNVRWKSIVFNIFFDNRINRLSHQTQKCTHWEPFMLY